MDFLGGAVVENLSANAGDARGISLIPGWGRYPGGGHGNPLQYCVENPRDRGAWWAIVHRGLKKSDMIERLNTPTQVTKWSVKNLSLLEVLQIINLSSVFKITKIVVSSRFRENCASSDIVLPSLVNLQT